MQNGITAIQNPPQADPRPLRSPRAIPRQMNAGGLKDLLDLGQSGGLTNEKAMGIVVERAMAQLRAVVTDARAQLGIPEGQALDTSPEATANRIADFALGAFGAWHKNHSELGEEDARKEFASFIGGAIQQGISEARGILEALNALNGEVNSNIDKTWGFIQERLDNFVAGE